VLGGDVPLRRGTPRGFGHEKIVQKHGITNIDVVRAVVRAPQVARNEPPGSGTWVHEKEAVLVGFGGVKERLPVRVAINYHGWQGPGPQGVVTAYCVGYNPRCPEWVNRAFAVD
jgi:hypothetical protein